MTNKSPKQAAPDVAEKRNDSGKVLQKHSGSERKKRVDKRKRYLKLAIRHFFLSLISFFLGCFVSHFIKLLFT